MTTELTTTQPLDIACIRHELKRDPQLKSDHTQRCYTADLAAFEKWRNGRFFTRLLVEQYASELQAAGRSPNTINRALASIRWYARHLAALLQETPAMTDQERREREELAAQAERAAGAKCVRGTRQPKGRHLTSGELAALMAACENDPTPAGARDAALIALAWATGMRRAELGGLVLADFTPTGEGEGDLLIRGKGDKERTAYLYNGAHSALCAWLAIRGERHGPVFCAIARGGHVNPSKRLSGESLRINLEKRIEEARVKPLTWHDFRRTFRGNLLDAGEDLVTVQKLMGHADPTTTSNYDRRDDEVKRSAVKKLFVPYRGRMM